MTILSEQHHRALGNTNGRRSDCRRDTRAPSTRAQRHLRLRAADLPERAIDRAGRPADTICRRPAAGLGALFHGDARRAGAAPSHPQRPALSLLSRRPDRAVHVARRGRTERIVVGPDLRGGQRLQQFIPGGTFHTARVIGQLRWFLGASTEWPGVVPADVEIGNLDELAAKYPTVADDLRAIAASVHQVA
jgi:Cupin superfamily (DUF985)